MLTVVLLVNSYFELILKRYSRCVFFSVLFLFTAKTKNKQNNIIFNHFKTLTNKFNIMTPQENKRAVYNNGFKNYYYKCKHCYSENVKQVVSGGFSPPNLVCNDCKTEVINSPITIEYFGEKENKTEENIYLNRLKEQYKTIESGSKANKQLRQTRYFAMREFCLDTQLVSFNDIELMESEINSSF